MEKLVLTYNNSSKNNTDSFWFTYESKDKAIKDFSEILKNKINGIIASQKTINNVKTTFNDIYKEINLESIDKENLKEIEIKLQNISKSIYLIDTSFVFSNKIFDISDFFNLETITNPNNNYRILTIDEWFSENNNK